MHLQNFTKIGLPPKCDTCGPEFSAHFSTKTKQRSYKHFVWIDDAKNVINSDCYSTFWTGVKKETAKKSQNFGYEKNNYTYRVYLLLTVNDYHDIIQNKRRTKWMAREQSLRQTISTPTLFLVDETEPGYFLTLQVGNDKSGSCCCEGNCQESQPCWLPTFTRSAGSCLNNNWLPLLKTNITFTTITASDNSIVMLLVYFTDWITLSRVFLKS